MTFFHSWTQLWTVCAVVAIAHFVNILLGFGGGISMISSLALLYPEHLPYLVVLLLLVRMPIEVVIVWQSRQEIRLRGVLLLLSGIAIGVPFGSYFLATGGIEFLLGVLGAIVAVLGSYFLFFEKKFVPPPIGAKVSLFLGMISGFFAGMFGTGGPPVVLYYRSQRLTKSVFRSNLMTTLLFIETMRVGSYLYHGTITSGVLSTAVVVMPFAVIGAWLGNLVHLRLAEERFQNLVAAAFIFMGLMLIAKVAG